MRVLSKSKLINYRQCPKRLWLEVHRPELRVDSTDTQASFSAGHQVGAMAQRLYAPKGNGELIDFKAEGFDAAFARSQELLAGNRPIFEAGFKAAGALAFADVMLPTRKAGQRAWRMVEVKSSTELKDYHRDDAAIQAFVARQSGAALAGVTLAHIDNTWVYPGGEDYDGLLKEIDLTQEAFARETEVKTWIKEAQTIVARRTAPKMLTGKHCKTPYPCGFSAHCQSQEPQAEYPAAWLPDVRSKALKDLVHAKGVSEMGDIPDALLNTLQQRVKAATLSGRPYFDSIGAADALSAHKLPAYFLDFETIQFAVPIWKGMRPYQQIPFQFSVQRLSRTGKLDETAFLDLSGKDPSKACAESLIAACGSKGPIFAYNAGFELGRIRELADRFPRMRAELLAMADRVVDLHPVARDHYYHPLQKGKWGLKKVLPAIAPDLRYEDLDEVQQGGMAMQAYLEAIAPGTSPARKAQIRQQLLDYCGLDTVAMVRLWKFFAGQSV